MTVLNIVLTGVLLLSIGIVFGICRWFKKRIEIYDGLGGISEGEAEQITVEI